MENIRILKESDLDFILQGVKEIAEPWTRQAPAEEAEDYFRTLPGAILEHLRKKEVIGCGIKEETAGFAVFHPYNEEMFLKYLYVASKFRGNRISRLLLREVAITSLNKNFKRIRLYLPDSEPGNSSLRDLSFKIYTKLGFIYEGDDEMVHTDLEKLTEG